jgi:hypothetical protein
MTGLWQLGNDVVDTLHLAGAGKARDARFLARVCSPEEQDAVRSCPDPDAALWVHWAGKEAIFKSASKVLGTPPVFRHPLFRVAFPEETFNALVRRGSPDPGPPLLGTGEYLDLRFGLSVERRGDSVHAVSWISRGGDGAPEFFAGCRESTEGTRGTASGLQESFSALEWECVTHRGSALARVLARKALASARQIPEETLEIRCGPGPPGRRIPSVWMGGKELPVDITLSHHGRFLAWAFLAV